MFINKAIIFGNISQNPELRTTTNGKNVCNFSVATNRKWTDGKGEKHDDAEFHKIVAWGKIGELVHQYMTKGSSIYIEGRIQTRSYEKDGLKRYITEIMAENIQFGPKKVGQTSSEPQESIEPEQEMPHQERHSTTNGEIDDIDPKDIPF